MILRKSLIVLLAMALGMPLYAVDVEAQQATVLEHFTEDDGEIDQTLDCADYQVAYVTWLTQMPIVNDEIATWVGEVPEPAEGWGAALGAWLGVMPEVPANNEATEQWLAAEPEAPEACDGIDHNLVIGAAVDDATQFFAKDGSIFADFEFESNLISLPATDAIPAMLPNAGTYTVSATLYDYDGTAWDNADLETATLFLQLDCGALYLVLRESGECQDGIGEDGAQVSPSEGHEIQGQADDGVFEFTFTRSDLGDAWPSDLEVTALHMMLLVPGDTLHFGVASDNAGDAAIMVSENGAPLLLDAAWTLQQESWNPILLGEGDMDGDGWFDAIEAQYGSDANEYQSQPLAYEGLSNPSFEMNSEGEFEGFDASDDYRHKVMEVSGPTNTMARTGEYSVQLGWNQDSIDSPGNTEGDTHMKFQNHVHFEPRQQLKLGDIRSISTYITSDGEQLSSKLQMYALFRDEQSGMCVFIRDTSVQTSSTPVGEWSLRTWEDESSVDVRFFYASESAMCRDHVYHGEEARTKQLSPLIELLSEQVGEIADDVSPAEPAAQIIQDQLDAARNFADTGMVYIDEVTAPAKLPLGALKAGPLAGASLESVAFQRIGAAIDTILYVDDASILVEKIDADVSDGDGYYAEFALGTYPKSGLANPTNLQMLAQTLPQQDVEISAILYERTKDGWERINDTNSPTLYIERECGPVGNDPSEKAPELQGCEGPKDVAFSAKMTHVPYHPKFNVGLGTHYTAVVEPAKFPQEFWDGASLVPLKIFVNYETDDGVVGMNHHVHTNHGWQGDCTHGSGPVGIACIEINDQLDAMADEQFTPVFAAQNVPDGFAAHWDWDLGTTTSGKSDYKTTTGFTNGGIEGVADNLNQENGAIFVKHGLYDHDGDSETDEVEAIKVTVTAYTNFDGDGYVSTYNGDMKLFLQSIPLAYGEIGNQPINELPDVAEQESVYQTSDAYVTTCMDGACVFYLPISTLPEDFVVDGYELGQGYGAFVVLMDNEQEYPTSHYTLAKNDFAAEGDGQDLETADALDNENKKIGLYPTAPTQTPIFHQQYNFVGEDWDADGDENSAELLANSDPLDRRSIIVDRDGDCVSNDDERTAGTSSSDATNYPNLVTLTVPDKPVKVDPLTGATWQVTVQAKQMQSEVESQRCYPDITEVTVDLDSLEGWTIEPTTEVIKNLNDGAVHQFDVMVTPPTIEDGARAGDEDTVTVDVTDTGNSKTAPAVSKDVDLEIKRLDNLIATIDDNPLKGKPGKTVTFKLRVTNEGNGADSLQPAIGDNPEGWAVTLTDAGGAPVFGNKPLPVGGSLVYNAKVKIPADAQSTDDADITINGVSGMNSKGAQWIVTAQAGLVAGVSLSAVSQEAEAQPGGDATFELTLSNLGNGPDSYVLSNADNDGAVTFEDLNMDGYTDNTVEISSGNEPLRAMFTVPEDALHLDEFEQTVIATSVGDPTVKAQILLTAIAGQVVGFNVLDSDDIELGGEDAIGTDGMARPGEKKLHEITIQNTGNGDDTFTFQRVWAEGDEDKWITRFIERKQTGEGDDATFGPGAVITGMDVARESSKTFYVEVWIPPGTSVGDYDTVDIVIASANDPAGDRTVTFPLTTDTELRPNVVVTGDSAANGDPGNYADFIVTVQNTGNGEGQFSLAAGEGWTATLTEGSDCAVTGVVLSQPFAIAQNSERDICLRVAIPDEAIEGDSSTITLTGSVAGRAGESITATHDITATANHVPVVSVTGARDEIARKPGESAFHSITIRNNGNGDDTYTVTATFDEDAAGWTYELLSADCTTPQTSISISRGDAGELCAKVTVGSEAHVGDDEALTVTATSDTNTDANANTLVATTVDLAPAVEVSAPTLSKDSDPGTVTYFFSAKNTGNGDDTFDITGMFAEIDNEGWMAEIALGCGGEAITEVQINADATQQLCATITVPHITAGSTGTLTATATSQDNNEATDSVDLTTTVSLVPGVKVTGPSESASADPGKTAQLMFNIENTGNGDDTFDLTASFEDSGATAAGWSLALYGASCDGATVSSIVLGEGQAATVCAVVGVPSDALAGATRQVNLLVGGSTVDDIGQGQVVTNQVARVWAWTVPGGSHSASARPLEYADFEYRFRNLGNGPDAFLFSQIAGLEWLFSFYRCDDPSYEPVTRLAMDAGDDVVLCGRVAVPSGALAGSIGTSLVRITSEFDSSKLTDRQYKTTVLHAPDVLISTEDSGSITDPAATAEYVFTVSNPSNGADTFTLSTEAGNEIVAFDGTDCGETPITSTGSMASGAALDYCLLVTVDANSPGKESRTDSVTATSTADAEVFDDVEFTTLTTFIPNLKLEVADTPLTALPGDEALFGVTATNIGNAPENYGLAAFLDDQAPVGWAVAFFADDCESSITETGTLAVSGSIDLCLAVLVDEDAAAGDSEMVDLAWVSKTIPDIGNLVTVEAVAGQYATVDVAATTTTGSALPEDVSTLAFSVSNDGNGVDNFVMSVTGNWDARILDASCESPVTTLEEVPADASVTLCLEVTVDSDAKHEDSETFTVTATSVFDEEVADSLELIVSAEQTFGATVVTNDDVAAKSAKPEESAAYNLRATNTGNGVDDLLVSASSGNGWTVAITGLTELQAGDGFAEVDSEGTGDFSVSVSVPAGTAVGVTDKTTVTITNGAEETVTIVLTTTVSESHGVSLKITSTDVDAKSSAAGSRVTYLVDATNTGNLETEYTFDIITTTAANGWKASVEPAGAVLGAGEVKQLTVLVDIPFNSAVGDSKTMKVIASGAFVEGISDEESLTTTATERFGVDASTTQSELTVQPMGAGDPPSPSGVGTLVAVVKNTGNGDEEYTISASMDSPGDWVLTFEPQTVNLDAGATTTVKPLVTVPTTAASGEFRMVTVTATGGPDDLVTDSVTFKVIAGQSYDVSITAPAGPVIRSPGQIATYEAELTNEGNGDDSFIVTASNGFPNGFVTIQTSDGTYLTSLDEVALSAGITETLTVSVLVPEGTAKGAAVDVTLTAESVGGNLVLDTTTTNVEADQSYSAQWVTGSDGDETARHAVAGDFLGDVHDPQASGGNPGQLPYFNGVELVFENTGNGMDGFVYSAEVTNETGDVQSDWMVDFFSRGSNCHNANADAKMVVQEVASTESTTLCLNVTVGDDVLHGEVFTMTVTATGNGTDSLEGDEYTIELDITVTIDDYDGDGVVDAFAHPDAGVTNRWPKVDADDDNDGFKDSDEIEDGSNPEDFWSRPWDVDGDGIPNKVELVTEFDFMGLEPSDGRRSTWTAYNLGAGVNSPCPANGMSYYAMRHEGGRPEAPELETGVNIAKLTEYPGGVEQAIIDSFEERSLLPLVNWATEPAANKDAYVNPAETQVCPVHAAVDNLPKDQYLGMPPYALPDPSKLTSVTWYNVQYERDGTNVQVVRQSFGGQESQVLRVEVDQDNGEATVIPGEILSPTGTGFPVLGDSFVVPVEQQTVGLQTVRGALEVLGITFDDEDNFGIKNAGLVITVAEGNFVTVTMPSTGVQDRDGDGLPGYYPDSTSESVVVNADDGSHEQSYDETEQNGGLDDNDDPENGGQEVGRLMVTPVTFVADPDSDGQQTVYTCETTWDLLHAESLIAAIVTDGENCKEEPSPVVDQPTGEETIPIGHQTLYGATIDEDAQAIIIYSCTGEVTVSADGLSGGDCGPEDDGYEEVERLGPDDIQGLMTTVEDLLNQ